MVGHENQLSNKKSVVHRFIALVVFVVIVVVVVNVVVNDDGDDAEKAVG